MQDLRQPTSSNSPTALARATTLLLVPVLVVVALPLLLLFIVVLYLLALLQGGRMFVFSWNSRDEAMDDPALQKPHFLEIETTARVISDESKPPQKG